MNCPALIIDTKQADAIFTDDKRAVERGRKRMCG